MISQIPRSEYDIFNSCNQKNNIGKKIVSEFLKPFKIENYEIINLLIYVNSADRIDII
jgi:hypothetical protein